MGVFLYARVFFFLILILLARVFVKIQLHWPSGLSILETQCALQIAQAGVEFQ
jgi:hypothetical protein